MLKIWPVVLIGAANGDVLFRSVKGLRKAAQSSPVPKALGLG